MHKNKKAQAAMEFLMTYGWAILVVLVVIGALAYFGILSPTALLPEKCFLPIGLDCEQHKVTETTADFQIRNGLGDSITVTHFWLEDNDGALACGDDTGAAFVDLTMANGQNKAISLAGCSNGVAGEKTKFSINMVYYKGTATTFTHSLEGELLTNIE